MKTRVDRFGRILIPKGLRDSHGLRPGTELRFEETPDGILLKTADEPRLASKDGVLIYTGAATGDLSRAVRAHREERTTKLLPPRKA